MSKSELEAAHIDELWRQYRPLEGRDHNADLILALIRKLVIQGARNIPYGNWRERLSHPLRTYGISEAEWDLTARAGSRSRECRRESAEHLLFYLRLDEILIGRSAFSKRPMSKLVRTNPTIAEAATPEIAAIKK